MIVKDILDIMSYEQRVKIVRENEILESGYLRYSDFNEHLYLEVQNLYTDRTNSIYLEV